MKEQLHNLVRLIAELGKEDFEQLRSHNRKKKLFDKIGKILDEMVNEH